VALIVPNTVLKNIWRVSSLPISTNTYICQTTVEGSCVIVDPGMQSEKIDEVIVTNNLKPTHVLCTHGHFDHIASASFFQNKYQSLVYLPRQDLEVAKKSNFLMKVLRFEGKITLPEFDQLVEERLSVNVDDIDWEFIPCPGHTDGSYVLKVGNVLFSGDSFYSEGITLSSLPGANSSVLRESLRALIGDLSSRCWVLPGHGKEGVLSDILDNNIELRDFLENT